MADNGGPPLSTHSSNNDDDDQQHKPSTPPADVSNAASAELQRLDAVLFVVVTDKNWLPNPDTELWCFLVPRTKVISLSVRFLFHTDSSHELEKC